MSIKVIEINSPEQLEAQFKKLAHTLHNLRFFTKYWNEHGGYEARKNMNNWQEKPISCWMKWA